jgi:hypothetical protein
MEALQRRKEEEKTKMHERCGQKDRGVASVAGMRARKGNYGGRWQLKNLPLSIALHALRNECFAHVKDKITNTKDDVHGRDLSVRYNRAVSYNASIHKGTQPTPPPPHFGRRCAEAAKGARVKSKRCIEPRDGIKGKCKAMFKNKDQAV